MYMYYLNVQENCYSNRTFQLVVRASSVEQKGLHKQIQAPKQYSYSLCYQAYINLKAYSRVLIKMLEINTTCHM
jgi:hypothetical protein